jgi:uncharacterized membrane protein (UPF0182 family)
MQRLVPQTSVHWGVAGTTLGLAVLGGLIVQITRTKIRLAASAATFGVAHPFLSAAENIVALLLSYLAFTHPVLAAACVVMVVLTPMLLIVLVLHAILKALGGLARRSRAGLSPS